MSTEVVFDGTSAVDGMKVWVLDPEFVKSDGAAVPGVIRGCNASDSTCTVDIVGSGSHPVAARHLFNRMDDNNLARFSDLTQIQHHNLPAVCDFLSQRLKARQIFTSVGPVTVFSNPFEWVNELYREDLKNSYRNSQSPLELLPHAWRAAASCSKKFLSTNKSQTIVLSGDSGSGKTETMKTIFKYFTSGDGILDVINIITEALGNATTIHNDNSSRFGKLIVMDVDRQEKCTSFSVRAFLLEKIRVCAQSPGERNFHVFYQMLLGFDSSYLSSLHLTKVDDYQYLTQGSAIIYDNDSTDIKLLSKAFHDIGYTDSQVDEIYKILAGILNMGNVDFEHDGETTTFKAGTEQFLDFALELWGLSEEKETFAQHLLNKVSVIGGQTIVSPREVMKAEAVRDTITKSMYDRLFIKCIDKLNARQGQYSAPPSMARNNSVALDASSTDSPGVNILDIAGFENMEENSLDQLLINLTNETLQSFFINAIVVDAMRIMEEDGVDRKIDVDINSNAQVIHDIRSSENSVIAKLNDFCVSGNNDSEAFLSSVLNAKLENVKVGKNKGEFKVLHSVETISYKVETMIKSNAEAFVGEIMDTFQTTTKNSMLSEIYEGVIIISGKIGRGQLIADQYLRSLKDLTNVLSASECSFIRCIKPNAAKTAFGFDHALVRRQLSALNLLACIKIMDKGFAFNMLYEEFSAMLMLNGESKKVIVDQCKSVLGETSPDFAVGNTRIFLTQKGMKELNHANAKRLNDVRWLVRRIEAAFIIRQRFKDFEDRYPLLLRLQANARSKLAS